MKLLYSIIGLLLIAAPAYALDPIVRPPVYGPELVSVGNLNAWSGGTPTGWTEQNLGTGTIDEETTNVHTAGVSAAKIVTGDSNSIRCFPTTLSLAASTTYRLDFWCRGDGTYSPRYGVYRGSYLVAINTDTGVTGTTYTLISTNFTNTTAGICNLFMQGSATSGAVVYFDDVSLKVITTAGILGGGWESWNSATDSVSWTESLAGTTTIAKTTLAANVYHGSSSASIVVDAGGDKGALQLPTALTVGWRYGYTIYGKAASGTPTLKVGTAANAKSHTLSTDWAAYTGVFAANSTAFEVSCATGSATIYVDSVTVTPLGVGGAKIIGGGIL